MAKVINRQYEVNLTDEQTAILKEAAFILYNIHGQLKAQGNPRGHLNRLWDARSTLSTWSNINE